MSDEAITKKLRARAEALVTAREALVTARDANLYIEHRVNVSGGIDAILAAISEPEALSDHRKAAADYSAHVMCQHGREPDAVCVPCSWAVRIVELEAENDKLARERDRWADRNKTLEKRMDSIRLYANGELTEADKDGSVDR
jgi:hypothetical protein